MNSKLTAIDHDAFAAWMRTVDRIIQARTHGMTADDLPDCAYHDWFDNGVASSTAATRAIKNARDY